MNDSEEDEAGGGKKSSREDKDEGSNRWYMTNKLWEYERAGA